MIKNLGRFKAPVYRLKGVLTIFAIVFATSVLAQDGEKLFKANCASCHKIDKKLVGPALQGVQDRWESQENIISWIKNSKQYLEDNPGDSYAHDLFKKFNESPMTAQSLSTEEVLAVLDYVTNWVPPVSNNPTPGPEMASEPAEDYTFYWLLGFLIVFVIIIKVIVDVRKSLQELLTETQGEKESPYQTAALIESLVLWFQRNKTVTALAIIGIVLYVLTLTWNALLGVGVYQGYAPEQPIKFSHKIHAGDNAINCVYCHHGAEKGRVAGIPSVNVCMNCHKGISEGKLYGTEEIAKIYEAAGYNPETGSYDKEEKPIEWIRIHNLPDFAYFNHSQHVVVGGQKCQTCHGPVEEIEYPMEQFAELTMGWCINCHRETDVQIAGNGYYEDMHQDMKEVFKDQPIKGFKVEHIGGLECAKCHY